jgi:hypothetical protein
MKKYNYFYHNTPIPKITFLSIVPENWESQIVDGYYSWGYFTAIELENE